MQACRLILSKETNGVVVTGFNYNEVNSKVSHVVESSMLMLVCLQLLLNNTIVLLNFLKLFYITTPPRKFDMETLLRV